MFLKKLAGAKGINVIEATVSTVNDIQQAAHSLVGKVDAVYVPTDKVMASSMPTLVAVTDEPGCLLFAAKVIRYGLEVWLL